MLFHCPYCDDPFGSFPGLVDHLAKDHSRASRKAAPAPIPSPEAAPEVGAEMGGKANG